MPSILGRLPVGAAAIIMLGTLISGVITHPNERSARLMLRFPTGSPESALNQL